MAKSAGILTATGGLASHAAVVARGWSIPAVVGASAVVVGGDGVEIAGRWFAAGETITIDGGTGEVFAGAVIGERAVVPEAAVLLGWARELGIEIPGSPSEEIAPTEPASAPPERPLPQAATPDDVLRALLVKGYATPEAAGVAVRCSTEEASELLDRLGADGLAEIAAGSFRLTKDGRAVAAEKLAADREAWGVANAVAALDAFVALDGRMKETVTAWQMREVDGQQAFNDHSDAAYDARVLGELGALHVDASAWLAPLIASLPRLGAYLERLDRAAASIAGGDGKYIASPRVDSYHTVWFELHEDLIHLAGRNRADEVAAGRA
jgi:pyruvate,orthophosphate dikinase